MERWLVELRGSAIDLEELPRGFPDGDVYAISEGEKVYLTGPAFEIFVNAAEVRDFAVARLDEFFGVINVLWSGFQKPVVSGLLRENAAGKRLVHHVLIAEPTTIRVKLTGTLSNAGSPKKPQAQILLASARGSKPLSNALLIWSDSNRTWPRLYRILEELGTHLEGPVNKSGFCSKKELTRFEHTANTDAAGTDSRHASEKYKVPKHPMTLHEGTEFVRRMIDATLRHEVSYQSNSVQSKDATP